MKRATVALAVLWALDLAWAAWVGLSLVQLGALVATLLVLAVNALVYRRVRGGERAYELAWTVAIFMALGTGFTVLSYLGLTLHMPLADQWLARCDALLGFDWTAWHRFVRGHALLNRLLLFGYRSLPLQILLTLFGLPLSGMIQRNREFLWATGLCLSMTVVVSALLPAESAWVWFHLDEPIAPLPLGDFLAMRTGELTLLNLEQLRGLVTFPSFHTSAAVLLAWAARGTRFALLSLVVNLLMIASTPSEGGHYLADVIAGIVVAVLAIQGARRIVGFDNAGPRPLYAPPTAGNVDGASGSAPATHNVAYRCNNGRTKGHRAA
jgi:membrane-associated phospholipid phosphatase